MASIADTCTVVSMMHSRYTQKSAQLSKHRLEFKKTNELYSSIFLTVV